MKGFKKYYKDENDLIDDYCNSVNCDACKGTDQNGEPNGYGCPGMEKFMEEYEEKLVLYDDDLVDFLEVENKKLQEENKLLRECVEFYASNNSWKKQNQSSHTIIRDDSCLHYNVMVGGKLARKTLTKIKGE